MIKEMNIKKEKMQERILNERDTNEMTYKRETRYMLHFCWNDSKIAKMTAVWRRIFLTYLNQRRIITRGPRGHLERQNKAFTEKFQLSNTHFIVSWY